MFPLVKVQIRIHSSDIDKKVSNKIPYYDHPQDTKPLFMPVPLRKKVFRDGWVVENWKGGWYRWLEDENRWIRIIIPAPKWWKQDRKIYTSSPFGTIHNIDSSKPPVEVAANEPLPMKPWTVEDEVWEYYCELSYSIEITVCFISDSVEDSYLPMLISGIEEHCWLLVDDILFIIDQLSFALSIDDSAKVFELYMLIKVSIEKLTYYVSTIVQGNIVLQEFNSFYVNDQSSRESIPNIKILLEDAWSTKSFLGDLEEVAAKLVISETESPCMQWYSWFSSNHLSFNLDNNNAKVDSLVNALYKLRLNPIYLSAQSKCYTCSIINTQDNYK